MVLEQVHTVRGTKGKGEPIEYVTSPRKAAHIPGIWSVAVVTAKERAMGISYTLRSKQRHNLRTREVLLATHTDQKMGMDKTPRRTNHAMRAWEGAFRSVTVLQPAFLETSRSMSQP
jgi:hypothetical protein